MAPKIVEADGSVYTACSGLITVYHPSREVADSSDRTYEITFTDEFGKDQDLKQVRSYRILQPTETLRYAMPAEAAS